METANNSNSNRNNTNDNTNHDSSNACMQMYVCAARSRPKLMQLGEGSAEAAVPPSRLPTSCAASLGRHEETLG